MHLDKTQFEPNHKAFIEKIVDTELLWGLELDDVWANSTSDEFQDTDVITFWSEKEGAEAVANDDWADFKLAPIKLSDFLEYWCVGMNNDGVMAGTNWNEELEGMEVEPLSLALEIVQTLKAKGKNIELEQFVSLDDFEAQLKSALDEG